MNVVKGFPFKTLSVLIFLVFLCGCIQDYDAGLTISFVSAPPPGAEIAPNTTITVTCDDAPKEKRTHE